MGVEKACLSTGTRATGNNASCFCPGALPLLSLPTNKTGWGLTSSHDDATTRRPDHLAIDKPPAWQGQVSLNDLSLLAHSGSGLSVIRSAESASRRTREEGGEVCVA